MPSVDYEPYLLEDLKDLEYAAGYLTVALEEGMDVFLLAVRQVVKAQSEITGQSQAADLNYENLYDMLSKDGNPLFSSITTILDKLGIELQFLPKHQNSKPA